MSEIKTPAPAATTQVFAVHGAEPEIQAYAMAKYSRSALSMRESLREISDQKAEKFLNTFYFQYGHRSIADLAHIALAMEKLSMLAAITVVDEQRWDGQERSTRYQDFKKSGYFVPEFGGSAEAKKIFTSAVDHLFAEYQALSAAMLEELKKRTPCPPEMTGESYERTLKARAFDISRYLLPLATNTSLGQIVNARTLEMQVSRMLSSEYPEIRRLANALKQAAREPAYNVNHEGCTKLVEEIRASDPALGARAAELLLKDVRVGPTLVKYAEANPYQMTSRDELVKAATELMKGAAINPAPAVDLLEDDSPEIELPTTLLYEFCHYPYRQIRERVQALSAVQRREIIELGIRHRGSHDELLRAFCSGQRFRFDILMDIGGFRDMHRHRRCIQIMQDYTFVHGCDVPEEVQQSDWASRYQAAVEASRRAAEQITAAMSKGGVQGSQESVYVMPMAYRKRTLFKMDFAEVVYISELRTTPAGHISYRRVAFGMYEETIRKYPELKACFGRVTDVNEPVDLLKR